MPRILRCRDRGDYTLSNFGRLTAHGWEQGALRRRVCEMTRPKCPVSVHPNLLGIYLVNHSFCDVEVREATLNLNGNIMVEIADSNTGWNTS